MASRASKLHFLFVLGALAVAGCNVFDDPGFEADEPCGTERFFEDKDRDGFGDPDAFVEACEQPLAHVRDDSDCDDDNPNRRPDGVEICDGEDNDCNGQVDDDAIDRLSWYLDRDADDYGAGPATEACLAPGPNYVTVAGDCNDEASNIYPFAIESCDVLEDLNCDGSVGQDDADGDGFVACLDCDDGDATVLPGADEVCDGRDNDCDPATPDGADEPTIGDDCDGADGDLCPEGIVECVSVLRCSDTSSTNLELCDGVDNDCDARTPDGLADPNVGVPCGADSEDASCVAATVCAKATVQCIQPDGAAEVCDDVDNDCDGATDEGLQQTWFQDFDDDGFGNGEVTLTSCARPETYSANDEDCNDDDGTIKPGAIELCDGFDNDCDDGVDEGCPSSCLGAPFAMPLQITNAHSIDTVVGQSVGLLGVDGTEGSQLMLFRPNLLESLAEPVITDLHLPSVTLGPDDELVALLSSNAVIRQLVFDADGAMIDDISMGASAIRHANIGGTTNGISVGFFYDDGSGESIGLGFFPIEGGWQSPSLVPTTGVLNYIHVAPNITYTNTLAVWSETIDGAPFARYTLFSRQDNLGGDSALRAGSEPTAVAGRSGNEWLVAVPLVIGGLALHEVSADGTTMRNTLLPGLDEQVDYPRIARDISVTAVAYQVSRDSQSHVELKIRESGATVDLGLVAEGARRFDIIFFNSSLLFFWIDNDDLYVAEIDPACY